jgi:hypothetical protein
MAGKASTIVAVVVLACALLVIPAAAAKDFHPGDLRVCGKTRCVAIVNKRVLRILSAYYYGATKIHQARPVRLGAPGFELRFTNGYVSGVVAGASLDRFRGNGFYCGRFVRGRWYRFPREATAALKKLTANFRPLRVSAPPPSC